MQELFSQLEVEHPELFNVNTVEGKKFINSYIEFIKLEKLAIETAFLNGKFTGQNGGEQTSNEYFEQEFNL